MATYGRTLRQGLPRTSGGEPWPPVGDAPVSVADASSPVTTTAEVTAPAGVAAEPAAAPAQPEVSTGTAVPATATTTTATVAAGSSLRRGLPRTPGGEPWPPAGVVAAPTAAAAPAAPAPAPAAAAPAAAAPTVAAATAPTVAAPVAAASAPAADGAALRRGLPRTPGGEPWPPAGQAPAVVTPAAQAVPDAAAASVATVATRPAIDVSTPLPNPGTVTPGRYAFVHPAPEEPKLVAGMTRGKAAFATILGGITLLLLAVMAVGFVQWFLTTPLMVDFLQRYPGAYDLPAGSEPGFPLWAQWQHYFNVFLMVLIIRSGWSVRTDRRPSAFWTPAWSKNGRGKISLTLWFHQSLDVLWLVNGIIFVVLLFVSGHWVRIVPTSWEVFPNALSAALQYVSLHWPVEHGWVNYNSLQQLMYFITVFIAAPLAAITGVRMSGLWPKNAKALNKAYPVEVARAIHFPVMLYFVIFIIVHVVLVFATGALRNLNHMFGNSDAENWTGFWIFFAGLVVIIGVWIAVRPLVLAPIAKLFGKVSMR